MTCLITGCALVDLSESRVVWGDLHKIGGAYVFNAVLSGGEAAWQYGEDFNVPSHLKILTVNVADSHCYFERRGVIIVSADAAELNAHAKEYIG